MAKRVGKLEKVHEEDQAKLVALEDKLAAVEKVRNEDQAKLAAVEKARHEEQVKLAAVVKVHHEDQAKLNEKIQKLQELVLKTTLAGIQFCYECTCAC